MIRVLVVDDDFAVARLHRRFLEQLGGFEVVGVLERGRAVAPFVQETATDLILLDVHLPDQDGLAVLSEMRSKGLGVDVIMITADNERESVRLAVGHGVQDYLVKPFGIEDFNLRLSGYRDRREQLVRHVDAAALAQDEIDQLMAVASGRETDHTNVPWLEKTTVSSADTPQLPKGFTAPTLAMVSESLKDAATNSDPTLSAKELSETCGISRVSARRYLDFLVSRQLAELKPRYGTTGRPEHRYRWRV